MIIIRKKINFLFYLSFLICFFLIVSNAYGYGYGNRGTKSNQSKSAANAKVFIVSPQDGAVVHSPVKIIFGLSKMEIVPAGVKKDFSGHHHLLIDVKKLPDLTQPIPADESHIHFGKGQTEVELNLSKGQHSLQLLLGDYSHIPHNKPVLSEKIHITVK